MDIQSRKDIELLMTTFYEKVKNDDTIGFIFNDIARVNWEHHIPIICDFWETLLLNAASYKKRYGSSLYSQQESAIPGKTF